MKKILIFILPLLLTFCRPTIKKKDIEVIPIYLKEFNITFLPDSCNCKMSIDLIEKKGKLDIELLTCDGKLNFKELDSLGRLIAQGSYIASLDTLKRYSVGKSVINDTITTTVLKYFQPIATNNLR
jgi:hypothetical protein